MNRVKKTRVRSQSAGSVEPERNQTKVKEFLKTFER